MCNMWRQHDGLPPIDAPPLQPSITHSGSGAIVMQGARCVRGVPSEDVGGF